MASSRQSIIFRAIERYFSINKENHGKCSKSITPDGKKIPQMKKAVEIPYTA